jgi:outer membrane protein TolC
VFDDGSARRAQAEASRRGAAHRLESERRALPLAVEWALAQLALTHATLDQQHEAVARRERVQALAQRRYAQGLDDWNATADSERMRLEAELEALRLRAQLWQALVDLERATAMALLPATP